MLYLGSVRINKHDFVEKGRFPKNVLPTSKGGRFPKNVLPKVTGGKFINSTLLLLLLLLLSLLISLLLMIYLKTQNLQKYVFDLNRVATAATDI